MTTEISFWFQWSSLKSYWNFTERKGLNNIKLQQHFTKILLKFQPKNVEMLLKFQQYFTERKGQNSITPFFQWNNVEISVKFNNILLNEKLLQVDNINFIPQTT